MSLQYALGEVTPLQASALALTLTIGYIFSVVIYRLYFHPLAKFPGPFWARISGIPAYLHTKRRDKHVWAWSLQEKYGPILRIGPNNLLINTPTGFKSVFSNSSNVMKAQYYQAYPRTLESITTFNAHDKNVHARKRRVLSHAFSEKAIRSAEYFVHTNVDRWCELLENEIVDGKWSRPFNMAAEANYLVFDILGDLCFGKSFGMKEPESQLKHVPEMMVSFLGLLHPIASSPFNWLWVWLKPRGLNFLLNQTAPPAFKNWEKFVETCFSERAEKQKALEKNPKPENEIKPDFFSYLFKALDPETGKLGYTLEELYGESELLIIAGSDTTSVSLAASFFYMARFPEVQEKLAKEVRDTFSSFDEIKGGPALSSCKYLRAFVEEALRMSPPVPADVPREVCAGGLMVDGHYLPEGTIVGTSHFCLHHNKDLYPDPFKFRPERWIVDEKEENGSTAEDVARAQSGFCAFSGGPRNCVGKNLAYLEMTLVLAKIVYKFQANQDPSSNNLGGGSPNAREGRRAVDQYQLYDIFVAIRDGPMIQLSKRED